MTTKAVPNARTPKAVAISVLRNNWLELYASHELMSDGSEQSKLAQTLKAATLFSSNILGGILVGYLLDRWFNTSPLMVITGIILGLISAIIGLVRILNRLARSD
jgi:F0F1-type ATP synthase assembly protein I